MFYRCPIIPSPTGTAAELQKAILPGTCLLAHRFKDREWMVVCNQDKERMPLPTHNPQQPLPIITLRRL
jgi:hypothetical protein